MFVFVLVLMLLYAYVKRFHVSCMRGKKNFCMLQFALFRFHFLCHDNLKHGRYWAGCYQSHDAHCILHEHCTLHIKHFTLLTAHCTDHCTMHITYFTLQTVHCTEYCTIHITYLPLLTAHCISICAQIVPITAVTLIASVMQCKTNYTQPHCTVLN